MLNFESKRNGSMLDRGEGDCLYGLIRALRPHNVVEVGTCQGGSACYIAQALQDNAFGHLTTCDPLTNPTFPDELKERITFLKCKGQDLKLDEPIDFLFIDGYHEKEWVDREIAALFPQLKDGALVVFHDSYLSGVRAGTDKLLTIELKTKNGLKLYVYVRMQETD
jgi:predicted O-methyltransferase YrrM